MSLNVQKRDPSSERQVLIGMASYKVVLGPIASRWTEAGLFASKWANLIGGWCVEHHKKFNCAPKRAIEHYYRDWAETGDRETADMVESLLVGLSDEAQRLERNMMPDHLLDIAAQLFERVQIKRLIEQADAYLEMGQVDKARNAIDRSRKIEIGLGAGINVLTDDAAFEAALEHVPESLIKYPDALGNFFADALYRGGFVAFMGRQKIGKSFLLQDLAWQAVEQGRNVAYFECGDSSEPEILQRLAARICCRPIKAERYSVPTWMETSGNRDLPQMRSAQRETHKNLSVEEERQARRTWADRVGPNRFKLSCHPADSLTVPHVETILEAWGRDDWHPDCVAEGSRVLTDKGLVPIEQVSCNQRLWDGTNWVSHQGSVYKGIKDVITYCGLTATPEHQVWTEYGWRSFISCARMGLRISRTGSKEQEIRVGRDYIFGYTGSTDRSNEYQNWQSLCQQKEVRASTLLKMQRREMGDVRQYQARNSKRVPQVPSEFDYGAEVVLSQDSGRSASMQEQKSMGTETLRRAGDKILFSVGVHCVQLDKDQFTRMGQPYTSVGSNRQRRTLRTGKSTHEYEVTKHFAHLQTSDNPYGPSISSVVSRGQVFGLDAERITQEQPHPHSDRGEMGRFCAPIRWGKAPVWDIINSGPLHRFTVEDVLTHNCVIVDYADIMAAADTKFEKRDQVNQTWIRLRALSQRNRCLVLTATQIKAEGFDAWLLGREHFSEDNRKYNHVTGMVGINQTDKEKENGIYRLNWILGRQLKFAEKKCVWTAGCLATGEPFLLSSF